MKLIQITVALCSILGLSWYVVNPNKGIRFKVLSPISALVIFLFTIYYMRFSLSANTFMNISSAFTTDLQKTIATYFNLFVTYFRCIGVYLGAALNWRNIRDMLVIIRTSEVKLKKISKHLDLTVNIFHEKEFSWKCSAIYIFAMYLGYYIVKLIYLRSHKSCFVWSTYDEKLSGLGLFFLLLICVHTRLFLIAVLERVEVHSEKIRRYLKDLQCQTSNVY